jgi:hypothetical protein
MMTKASINKNEQTIKKLSFDLDKKLDECMKVDQECKVLKAEREKMKQRIIKLKSRKGKVDQGIKMCKLCALEYHDKENFNWSCRTHRGVYGGEMWWCCGKRGKDQPGCKFSKHESKDDEDEDDEHGKRCSKGKHLKYMRCNCCKELGHTIDTCPRDPNMRTMIGGVAADPYDELERTQKIEDFRKLFADTAVTTTHFLKKCVRVPRLYAETGSPEGLSKAELD